MDKKLLEICRKKVNNEINLTWNEISEKYPMYKNGESLRKAFSRQRKNKEVKVGKSNNIDLDKEKIELNDKKTELRRLTREYVRLECLKDIVVESVQKLNKTSRLNYKPNNITKRCDSEKEGVLLLSDWHFGIEVDNAFNKYNKKIFEERLEKVIEGCISSGITNGISKLHVCNLNDLISGVIHTSIRASNNEDVISQVIYISEKVAQMLIKFAEFFKKVEFYNCIDNHARVIANKNDSLNKENFARIIPWFVRERVRDISNIRINDTVDDEIAEFYVCGHLCFGVHGHNDRVKSIVSDLTLMMKQIPDFVFLGHFHKNYEDEINGIDVIVNPGLVGIDEYAKNIRKTSKIGQKFMIFNREKRISTIYL